MRPWLPIFCLMLVAVAYSGRWRPSRDGALYRALGADLAAGKGYTFRGDPEPLAYPGLPYVLAAIDVAAPGRDPLRPRLALVLMAAAALACLYVFHRVLLHASDARTANLVVVGITVNALFLRHSAEILTDLPFLVAVGVTFAGLEALPRRHGCALVAVGLSAARLLRPPYWALACERRIGNV